MYHCVRFVWWSWKFSLIKCNYDESITGRNTIEIQCNYLARYGIFVLYDCILFVITINLLFLSLSMFPLYITKLLYELIQVQVVSDWSGEGFLWHCGVDTYAIQGMGQKISLHHNSVRHKWPSVQCNPYFHFTSIFHTFLTWLNQIKCNIILFEYMLYNMFSLSWWREGFKAMKKTSCVVMIGIMKGMV